MGRKIVPIFERLGKYQIQGPLCWGWSGAKYNHGYGLLSNRKGSTRKGFSPEKTHRVSYEKHFGLIPDGLCVLHKCDNPECTNPEHLFLGTQKDNMRDCARKHRLNKKSLLNLVPGCKGYLGAKMKGNKVEL